MNNSSVFTKSEFAYFRAVTILDIALKIKTHPRNLLPIKKSNIHIAKDEIYINYNHIQQKYTLPSFANEYFFLLKKVVPRSPYLFPTIAGDKFRYPKFIEHLNRLFKKTSITSPCKPEQISQKELEILLAQQFSYQRKRYQYLMVGGLMGTMATRPGEIAQLEKKDVYLDAKIVKLRKTKGQEIQQVPIHPALISPLRKYLAHLPNPKTPLFIRSTGKKWSRKDVLNAMKEFGKYCGIDGVTAQRMRPTVVHELYNNGASLIEIQDLTRHKQVSTLTDHYIAPLKDDARKALSHLHPFPAEKTYKSQKSKDDADF